MKLYPALFALAVFAYASTATASEIAPEDVKIVDGAIEQPLTDEPGNAERGLAAFTGRKAGNCLACHYVESLLDDYQFHGEVGTPLDGIGDVYTAAEFRAKLVNPKTELPDTIMPAFYRTSGFNRAAGKFEGKTILTAQQVEDVIAYLMTLKD